MFLRIDKSLVDDKLPPLMVAVSGYKCFVEIKNSEWHEAGPVCKERSVACPAGLLNV
jgi:hypothetical protein